MRMFELRRHMAERRIEDPSLTEMTLEDDRHHHVAHRPSYSPVKVVVARISTDGS